MEVEVEVRERCCKVRGRHRGTIAIAENTEAPPVMLLACCFSSFLALMMMMMMTGINHTRAFAFAFAYVSDHSRS